MSNSNNLDPIISSNLKKGCVIPAHPLSLTAERHLNECSQLSLTRYYLDAGAGGVAVGVHTTQFSIRDPNIGLHQPVLELAQSMINEWERNHPEKKIIRVAGICGDTQQAVKEAQLALDHGYHIALLSLSALKNASNDEMIAHTKVIAEMMPVMGFYLQPSVGGRILDYAFWTKFFAIENVCAVKMAPFNRYQTIDVLRAVVDVRREDDIALYTGNDDNIVMDLLTGHVFIREGKEVKLNIVGGLLGHWAVWTKKAVELLDEIDQIKSNLTSVPKEMLTRAIQVTDSNAAFFDAANRFHGCIAGLHEVLCRQGLMDGRWCLDPNEDLSPGQLDEINRVYNDYPHLCDDEFVHENKDQWLIA